MLKPKYKFAIGFANSMFQSSGEVCGESNWTEAARKGSVPKALLPISHWDNFEADLDLMQTTGVNSYRISMEWSHIEPIKNQYNTQVLDRYMALIDACLKRHITPMITLYHFNEPLWFTSLGSFEKEANIEHYISYCKHVFHLFSSKVSLWCTINEPAVQAFSGYLLGQFPPHKHDLKLTIIVLKHLMKAHVDVYQELKALPHGDACMIGIVHNVLRFKSRHGDRLTSSFTDELTTITDDLVIDFFKTGRLDYKSSIWGLDVHYEDARASRSNDFFGLNFYANPIIGFNLANGFGATCYPGQEMGDMYLAIDPQGFSEAIDEVNQLGLPIYITETGIADQTDIKRQHFLTQYCAVIHEKLARGVDIRGCFFWVFRDNYEWNEGGPDSKTPRLFGFFKANNEPRESVGLLKEVINKFTQLTVASNGLDIPVKR